MLEALKSGERLTPVLERYHHLGLSSIDPDMPADEGENADQGSGKFLLKVRASLKRIAGVVAGLIIASIKTLAKSTKLKPIIGFAGVVPTITIQINADFMDLFEYIRSAFTDTPFWEN